MPVEVHSNYLLPETAARLAQCRLTSRFLGTVVSHPDTIAGAILTLRPSRVLLLRTSDDLDGIEALLTWWKALGDRHNMTFEIDPGSEDSPLGSEQLLAHLEDWMAKWNSRGRDWTYLVTPGTKEHTALLSRHAQVVGATVLCWEPDYQGGRSILTSPENKGQVFVKGMFVSQENTRFGYDFEDADIDRDRRMISDLHDKIGNLLANALHDGKLVTDIFDLMQSGSDEVSYVSGWRVSDIGSKHLADEFVRRNPGVIPVERDEQVKELEAYGKKARQVTWGMRTILERELGYAADVLAKLRKSEKVLYSVSELEQVDFHDDICIGTYDPSSSKIRLARKILKDRGKALYTLVHEVAHTHGGDGIRSHEESIGKIMETILNEVI